MALYVVSPEDVARPAVYVEAPSLGEAVSVLLKAGHGDARSIERLSEKNVLRGENETWRRFQVEREAEARGWPGETKQS